MKKILTILSSYKGAGSISSKLAQAVAEKLKAAYPGSSHTERDLEKKAVHQLNTARGQAVFSPEDQLTNDPQPQVTLSDQLLSELTGADIIVIGLGLYNYGIPSTLKVWIDEICRPGITFFYNEKGEQVGMLTGKKVYIAMASGGIYSAGPIASWDHAIPYLKTMFHSIGITDITVYRAEGMGIAGIKETALQNAIESIAF